MGANQRSSSTTSRIRTAVTNTCMTCDLPVLIPVPNLPTCTCAVPTTTTSGEDHGQWIYPMGAQLTDEEMHTLLHAPPIEIRRWQVPTLNPAWTVDTGTPHATCGITNA